MHSRASCAAFRASFVVKTSASPERELEQRCVCGPSVSCILCGGCLGQDEPCLDSRGETRRSEHDPLERPRVHFSEVIHVKCAPCTSSRNTPSTACAADLSASGPVTNCSLVTYRPSMQPSGIVAACNRATTSASVLLKVLETTNTTSISLVPGHQSAAAADPVAMTLVNDPGAAAERALTNAFNLCTTTSGRLAIWFTPPSSRGRALDVRRDPQREACAMAESWACR